MEKLESDLGVTLPIHKAESPSKRRKSPLHDAVNHIRFLYYHQMDGLSEALDHFHVKSPANLEQHDRKVNRLLETLGEAVKAARHSGAPYDTPRSLSRHANQPREQSHTIPEPQSPSLAVKHAPPVEVGIVVYPKLPSISSDRAEPRQHSTTLPNGDVSKSFGEVSAVRSSKSLFDTTRAPSARAVAAPPNNKSTTLNNMSPTASTVTAFKTLGPMPSSTNISKPAGSVPKSTSAVTIKAAPNASASAPNVSTKRATSSRSDPPRATPVDTAHKPVASTTVNTSFTTTGITSANTSFTTVGTTSANTSFWSDPTGSQPIGSQEPASPASTINMDGANDLNCTQQTDYGGWPSSQPSSQCVGAKAPERISGISLYSGPLSSISVEQLEDLVLKPHMQGHAHSRVATKASERISDASHYTGPLSSVDEQQLEELSSNVGRRTHAPSRTHAKAPERISDASHYTGPLSSTNVEEVEELASKSGRQAHVPPRTQSKAYERISDVSEYSGPLSAINEDQIQNFKHNPGMQVQTPPLSSLTVKTAAKKETRDSFCSQTSTQLGDASIWRAQKIISDGLIPVKLPRSLESLPWPLPWEASRVLQTKQLSAKDLVNAWEEPRTLESLQTLVQLMELKMKIDVDADFSQYSFPAQLEQNTAKSKDAPLLSLVLLPPIKQARNEFERAYGGGRVFTLDYVPPGDLPIGLGIDDVRAAVHNMICQDHRLFGRTWVQFFTREKKAKAKVKPGTIEFYFFATSGHDIGMVTITTFLDRLMPFRENADQLSGKFYSRLEMLASRTWEGPKFHLDQIEVVDDSTATDEDDAKSFRDPSLTFCDDFDPKHVMSDGCGLISAHAMRWICRKVGWTGPLPSAVRARFFGSKGVWVLRQDVNLSHIDASAPKKLITITRSQQKILQHSGQKEFQFLVVGFALPPKPSVLHPGFLPIMHDRHVSAETICNAASFPLSNLLDTFKEASKNPDDLRRWMHEQNDVRKTVDRHLGISTVGGFSTFAGERIIRMLESGFEPSKNRFLAQELQEMMEKTLQMKAKRYKIPCLNSTTLMGVLDWTGTLKPGEVHIRLSKSFEDAEFSHFDLGRTITECIIGRNPARRPSDLQKLRIVQKSELNHLVDVVVFSTRGRQAEASKMQGGDYDGDTFWVCWEREIVKNFKNAPAPRKAVRGDPENYCLEKDSTRVGDIVKISSDRNKLPNEAEVREWLSINSKKRTRPNLLGMATKFWERLVYHHGKLTSKCIDALNDLCDYLIDAQKQCLKFTKVRWWQFLKKWELGELPDPAYFTYTQVHDEDEQFKGKEKCKPKDSSILDRVYCVWLRNEAQAALQVAKAMFPDVSLRDHDLDHIFNDRRDRAAEGSAVRMELDSLFDRIVEVQKRWHADIKPANKETIHQAMISVREFYESIRPLNTKNETIQEWMVGFGNDRVTQWDFLKASAFALRCNHHGREGTTKMQFAVAGHELCLLKAQATGLAQTLTASAYFSMKPMKRKAFAVLRAKDGDVEVQKDEEFDEEAELDDEYDDDDFGDITDVSFMKAAEAFDNADMVHVVKETPTDVQGRTSQYWRMAPGGGLERIE